MGTFAEFTAKKKQKKTEQTSTGRTFAEFTAQKKGLTTKDTGGSQDTVSAPMSGGKKFQITDVAGKYENLTGTGGNKYDPLVKSVGLDMIGNGGIDALVQAVARQEEAERQKQMLIAADAQRKGKTTEEQLAEDAELAGKTVWSGIGQLNKGVASTLAFAEGLISKPIDKAFGDGEGYKNWPLYRLNEYYSDIDEQFEAERQAALDDKGIGAQLASEVGKGVVSAIPQALLALATGGGSAAAQIGTANAGLAASVGESLRAMVKSPAFIASVAQTLGPAYEQEIENGANEFEAAATAIISTALNAGVEIGGGLETLPTNIRSGGRSAVGEWVKSMLDEGKEEVIQSVISGITSKALSDPGKEIFSMTNENAILNPGRMAKEFGMGAAVGGFLGGAQIGAMTALNPQVQAQERLPDDVRTQTLIRNLPRQPVQTQEPATPKMGAEVATEMGLGKHGAEAAQQAAITPENVGAFTAYYDAGKDGKAIEEVKTVQTGIDENVARQAFNAGQMDAIAEGNTEQEVTENAEERNESGREGSERQIGMAAAERSGGIPEGTGSAAERREAQRLRAEEIRNSVNAAGQVNTSAAAQGIAEGTSKQSFKLVPAKLWTNEVRTAVHDLAKKGIQGIPIVGELEMVDENGPYMARAAISRDGKRVWFSLDDPDVEFERLIEHEEYHLASIKDPGLVEKTRQAVISKYDEETLAKVVELYVDTYGWGNLSKEYILGEIFGDANGAINEFEDYNLAGATLFTDVVRNVARNADMQSDETADSAKAKFKGYDAKTGKGIYESNFPKGTPKAAKAQRILNYIQNVWSKNPIRLVVEKPGEAPREIMARFDPTYDQGQNIPTDASKLMGGNRHGNASEQRVTLDLADDYYQIASESGYNGFKEETGKDSPTHYNVKEWHYFVNDILFQEYGETETAPYRVTINVKERSDGSFVYSFNAEREDKRPSTRRTLHADVNQSATSGEANAQPSTYIVDQGGENVNTQTSRAPSKAQLEKAVAQYIEKYGAIEPGENPFRTVQVPKKTSDTEKVSYTARTAMEAEATPADFVPLIENEIVKGGFSFVPVSNDETTKRAKGFILGEGWQSAWNKWSADVKMGKADNETVAIGALLYNHAVNAGDYKAALDILTDYQVAVRNSARGLQAARILKKLSPDARLYMINKDIQKLVEELKLDEPIELPPSLVDQYMKAKTNREVDNAVGDIQEYVAAQIPSTGIDMWTALRYTNMLGNFKTQVRNVAGNVGMRLVSEVENAAALAVEKLAGGKLGRTRALFVDKQLRQLAKEDFANVRSEAMGETRYTLDNATASSFLKGVQDKKTVFKRDIKVFGKDRTLPKVFNAAIVPMEYYRKATNWAMNNAKFGDEGFTKSAYARALGEYLKANGVTAEQFGSEDWQQKHGDFLDKARQYAVARAQELTFRDHNAFSNAIASMGRKPTSGKWTKVLSEGVLPFRRTPANVLVRAEEYSPLGLINTAIKAAQLAKGKENVTGNDVVNSLAKTITGTGIFLVGMAMHNMGLLRGGDDEDEKVARMDDLMGHQTYALEIGGVSYTLDWLTPTAMPLFMGAQLNNLIEDGGFELKDIYGAIVSLADPMLQMSMLSGLNDTLDNIRYIQGNGLLQIALNAGIDYLTQGLTNSLMGQLDRTLKDVSEMTFTDSQGDLPTFLQKELGAASRKVPVWDYSQIPYIDAWGRTESNGSVPGRILKNFLSPGYVSEIGGGDLEDEILELYQLTGDGGVFPSTADKHFPVKGEEVYLNADEYVQYATKKGQLSYEIAEKIMKSSVYRGMSDEEKANAISDAYALANVIAKKSVSKYETEGWKEKAVAAKKLGIDYSKYLEVRLTVKDIESLKDKDGKSINGSKSLQIMEAIYNIKGLNDKQRLQLFEDFGVGESYWKDTVPLNKAAVEAKLKTMR